MYFYLLQTGTELLVHVPQEMCWSLEFRGCDDPAEVVLVLGEREYVIDDAEDLMANYPDLPENEAIRYLSDLAKALREEILRCDRGLVDVLEIGNRVLGEHHARWVQLGHMPQDE